jgi:hypothetical protein
MYVCMHVCMYVCVNVNITLQYQLHHLPPIPVNRHCFGICVYLSMGPTILRYDESRGNWVFLVSVVSAGLIYALKIS